MSGYGYQRETDGYSVWMLGLSGSRVECVAWSRTRREAQRIVDRLYASTGKGK